MLPPLSRSSLPETSSMSAPALDGTHKAASSNQEQRAQLNSQILQASLNVSISAGDNSLALLYRTAIDNINQQLAPELGSNALQAAMQQDNSPEATAERILSQSTAFFDAYARQHPNKDPKEVLENFIGVIRAGFEKGYNEAANILSGLGVMGEEHNVASEIAKTYALVQQGYDDFLAAGLEALQDRNNPNSSIG